MTAVPHRRGETIFLLINTQKNTMFNRSHFLFSAFLALGLMAQAGAASAEMKFVTVRAAELVQGSPQFKAGQTQMKSEFDRRKTDLEAEAKRLGDDIQKFKREGDVMSADARSKTEKDLNTRKIDFDYKQRQFSEDFSKRDRELTEGMMDRIKETIVAVAKERGAVAVMQDPVYADPSVDITADVLKRLQSAAPPATGK